MKLEEIAVTTLQHNNGWQWHANDDKRRYVHVPNITDTSLLLVRYIRH